MLQIDPQIRDAVVNYLAGQPFREVAQLIQALLQLQPEEKPAPQSGT